MLNISQLIAAKNPDRFCFYPVPEGDGFMICSLPLFAGDFCAEHGCVSTFQTIFRDVMYESGASRTGLDGYLMGVAALHLHRDLLEHFGVHIPSIFLYAMLARISAHYLT